MWPLFMHQYCNLLSFLISRQKLGPHSRSEWLWAAPTGAHSQPATCVQRGQVPQTAWARATPSRAHSRAALPTQAGRHRPRYLLRGPPGASFLVQGFARGLGQGCTEGWGRRLSQLQADEALQAPHLTLSFTASTPASGARRESTSLGPRVPPGVLVFPDPTSVTLAKLFPKRHSLQTCLTLIFIHVFHGMNFFFRIGRISLWQRYIKETWEFSLHISQTSQRLTSGPILFCLLFLLSLLVQNANTPESDARATLGRVLVSLGNKSRSYSLHIWHHSIWFF